MVVISALVVLTSALVVVAISGHSIGGRISPPIREQRGIMHGGSSSTDY